ncbi:MAG: SGNH/GDSL hydrolase family protein [Planctomycetes bacterium]|nr:SGNH/GDSL hydrolase family protein [Planctomycetota bacterium]
MFVRSSACVLFLMVLARPIPQVVAQQEEIDWTKAKLLHQRFVRGEKLTEEEQAYHDQAAQALRVKAGAKRPTFQPSQPPGGLKPLSDMTAGDRYKEQDGGLYGGGSNEPPDKHLQAALQQAKAIQPLDAKGQPAEAGKIGFLSIGMSNTTQEFSMFVLLANADSAKSPNVVIVDGAQGGMDARAWADPGSVNRPGARTPWDVLDERLQRMQVADEQVQVAWVKQARMAPGTIGEFPRHAEEMKGHMVTILNSLKERFPNLRIAYLSSRIYGGYATTALNPEPYAYESAFVVRWLIQDQINGDSRLNFDPAKGAVTSPLLLWGLYLWADGKNGRKSDDLVWTPDDFRPDGTHPSDSGRRKVAEQLLRFVKTDPSAKLWFIGED